MALTKIINADEYTTNNIISLSGVDQKMLGVEDLPDVPNYESSAIKKKLDEIAKHFLAPFINHLIGEIETEYATKKEVQDITIEESGGAMLQLVYDTEKKQTDVFQYADNAANTAASSAKNSALTEAKNYADSKASTAQTTATAYCDNKLSHCYISFTDENGRPTSEPYIHWDD